MRWRGLRPNSTRMRSDAPAVLGDREEEAGEQMRIGDDDVVEIRHGVVATRACHADGEEVLLDLAGPGQLVLGHPMDECHILHVAVTDVVVRRLAWSDVVRSADLVMRLRDQLRWREAWAAAQAHTRTEDQLAGILARLAERFGVVGSNGVMIDVPLTHAQLAAATGRTRPTVTRALRRMVNHRIIGVAGTRQRQRYVLPLPGSVSAHAARQ